MAKRNPTPLTSEQIITRLNKPKSMRYIRKVMKPLFEEARAKFDDAIVDIVEREHWGPNFDAYYDVWVRRQWPDIREFFTEKLLNLLLERYVFVLTQIKKTDDYRDNSRKLARNRVDAKKICLPSHRTKANAVFSASKNLSR